MADKEYTKEQEKLTYEILEKNKHSFYELLRIEKHALDSDVKKAYRKMAIKLHPDKNRHPRAAEAFKRVNRAFEVLSDHKKRKTYDHLGYDPDDRAAAQESYRNGGGSGFRTGKGDGIFSRNTGGSGNSADDLFDFLFRSGARGGPFGMGGPFDFGSSTTFAFGGPSGFKVYSSGPSSRFSQHHEFDSGFQGQTGAFNQGENAPVGQDSLQHMLVIVIIALVFILLPGLGF